MRSGFNKMSGIALLLPLIALTAPSFAQDQAEAVYTPASALGAQPTGGSHRIQGGDHFFVLSSKVGTGEGDAEEHMTQSVYYIVKDGHADVTVGSHVEGDKEIAPNERTGGHIVGGKTYHLGPDDTLFMPAGMAHQVVIPKGEVFRYYAIRFWEDRPCCDYKIFKGSAKPAAQ